MLNIWQSETFLDSCNLLQNDLICEQARFPTLILFKFTIVNNEFPPVDLFRLVCLSLLSLNNRLCMLCTVKYLDRYCILEQHLILPIRL